VSDGDQPLGVDVVRQHGWSHLCIVCDGDTWFRDPRVYAYFDRLTDDGFFEDFEQVLFYGAGPCGYAAAAFSVAAPGATVMAVQPQATLDPRMTEWDPRFTEMRRTSFTDRYGYAPDMLDAANEAFVIYDPREELDAMHASLFQRKNVTRLRMANMGGTLQSDLLNLGLLLPLIDLAGTGDLSSYAFYDLYRMRRNYPPYLRRLAARLDAGDRPYLNMMLCRNALTRMSLPRLRRRLDQLVREARDSGAPIPAGLA